MSRASNVQWVFQDKNLLFIPYLKNQEKGYGLLLELVLYARERANGSWALESLFIKNK
jgi:hypothetical protein